MPEKRGLLPEDRSDIRIVPDAVRQVWEPKRRYTVRQAAAIRRRGLEALAAYRARKALATQPSSDNEE